MSQFPLNSPSSLDTDCLQGAAILHSYMDSAVTVALYAPVTLYFLHSREISVWVQTAVMVGLLFYAAYQLAGSYKIEELINHKEADYAVRRVLLLDSLFEVVSLSWIVFFCFWSGTHIVPLLVYAFASAMVKARARNLYAVANTLNKARRAQGGRQIMLEFVPKPSEEKGTEETKDKKEGGE